MTVAMKVRGHQVRLTDSSFIFMALSSQQSELRNMLSSFENVGVKRFNGD